MTAGSDPGPAKRPRDPRLDVFRGFAMLIIFVAHVPWNAWANWIPARFGFSDATEMFVFCSGFASALAFGGTYRRAGWRLGTARILRRCWQIYWAHVGLFLAVTAIVVTATGLTGRDYVAGLNLQHFMADPGRLIVGLLTLTYVPNYFDILPMYIAVLAMVPAVMALARVHPLLVAAFVVVLWGLAWLGGVNPPAEPWSDRPWFFNPFGWQAIFFTGFAFGFGWLQPPPATRGLVALALVLLLASVPLSRYEIYADVPWLLALRGAIEPLIEKTGFGPLRLLHFLAIAYVCWALARGWERRLTAPLLAPVRKVGQQSLAVFLFSMALAQVAGVVLDQIGRSAWAFALVNLAGFACLIACAYLAGWFKNPPWERRPARPALTAVPANQGGPAPDDRPAMPQAGAGRNARSAR